MHPVSQLFSTLPAAPWADVTLPSLQDMLLRLNLSDPHCDEGALDPERLSSEGRGPASHRSNSSSRNSGDFSFYESSTSDNAKASTASVGMSAPAAEPPSKRSSRRRRNQENRRRQAEANLAVALREENCQYKTELCAQWQATGCCLLGETCPAAHGMTELRTATDNQSAATCLAKLMGKFTKAQKLQAKQAKVVNSIVPRPAPTAGPSAPVPAPWVGASPQYSPMGSPVISVGSPPVPVSPVANVDAWAPGASRSLPPAPVFVSVPRPATPPQASDLVIRVGRPPMLPVPAAPHVGRMAAPAPASPVPCWGSPASNSLAAAAPFPPSAMPPASVPQAAVSPASISWPAPASIPMSASRLSLQQAWGLPH